MRKINLIVIHCTAAPDGRADTITDVDAWHRQLGWMRTWKYRHSIRSELTSIGYHWLITVDGVPHPGRSREEIGSHAVYYNAESIGVCLAGTSKFTVAQWRSLKETISLLLEQFPGAKIVGHRDLPGVHKTCPGFDVAKWLAAGMAPPADNIL